MVLVLKIILAIKVTFIFFIVTIFKEKKIIS